MFIYFIITLSDGQGNDPSFNKFTWNNEIGGDDTFFFINFWGV